MRRYVVGITGASGSLCARSVLRHLARHPEVERVHAVLSAFSLQTLSVELGRGSLDYSWFPIWLIETKRTVLEITSATNVDIWRMVLFGCNCRFEREQVLWFSAVRG